MTSNYTCVNPGGRSDWDNHSKFPYYIFINESPSKIADKEQIIFQFYMEADEYTRLTPTVTICTSFLTQGTLKTQPRPVVFKRF